MRLDLSTKTGLLVRMVRYADTPMGRATQIDYSDYRDADGVKSPFRWMLSRPAARFTIQLSEVKSNAEIRLRPVRQTGRRYQIGIPAASAWFYSFEA